MVEISGIKKEKVTLEVSPEQVFDAISKMVFEFINDEHAAHEEVVAKLSGKRSYFINITDRCYIDDINWKCYFEHRNQIDVVRVASEREIDLYQSLEAIKRMIWDIEKKENEK